MSQKRKSSLKSHNYFHGLSKALEYAVSEWLLMLLLFIDACFTYLIAKFASYCQLQGPCLLCSRYDHVLVKDKKGIYRNSICHHHKSEISSVVRCHAHDKLVDVHGICESCLLWSDTKTKNKFSDEAFRLLAGKMKFNPLVEDENRDSSGSRICFCCNEQYVSRDYVKHFLSTSSVHNDAKNEKNIFVDKSLDSLRTSQNGTTQVARSPEFEYHKVDVDSDNESEHLVSVNGGIRAFDLEVHLKPGSQFEVHDLHNGPAIIERRDFEEPKWQNDVNKENLSQVTEQISFDDVPQSNNSTTVDLLLETSDPSRKDDLPKDPVSDGDPSATANGHQVSNYLDLGDAYKLAISAKGRQLSGKLLDHKSFKESSTRVSEDLKILLSYRSNDNLISPKRSLNSDESTQFLQSRISLERNESNLSFDGSILSEIDGENVVDRLKRQVEHDKKLMSALYRELEEERNASAVATNQAMAMITRLQEEKAALYTEALQSIRMMEEQAEYDSEALQKAIDVIEEKDKQIQDLEELLKRTSEDTIE